jgi:hypothetical protein
VNCQRFFLDRRIVTGIKMAGDAPTPFRQQAVPGRHVVSGLIRIDAGSACPSHLLGFLGDGSTVLSSAETPVLDARNLVLAKQRIMWRVVC